MPRFFDCILLQYCAMCDVKDGLPYMKFDTQLSKMEKVSLKVDMIHILLHQCENSFFFQF